MAANGGRCRRRQIREILTRDFNVRGLLLEIGQLSTYPFILQDS